MRFKKIGPKVFTISKEHKNRKRFVFIIELLAVFLLLVGTGLTFFGPREASPVTWFANLEDKFSVKKIMSENESVSFEEQVTKLVDGKILHVSSLKKSSQGFFVLESTEGIKVILSESKDLKNQIGALQTVLSKAKIDKQKVILIDFRLEKLVVRYSR